MNNAHAKRSVLSRALEAAGGAEALVAALEAAGAAVGSDAMGDAPRLTLMEFAYAVIDSLPSGSAKTYRPYIKFFVEGWSVPPADFERVSRLAKAQQLALGDLGDLPLGPRLPRVNAPANKKRRSAGAQEHLVVFQGLGEQAVEEINEVDVLNAAKWVRVRAQLRAEHRAEARHDSGRSAVLSDGRGAAENFIGAMRALFRVAGGDQRIRLAKADNPARDVPKPERGVCARRALSDDEVTQAWNVTRLGGNDPDLDCLLFRLHIIAGARQEGALNLRLRDVVADTCELWLDEKGGKQRWQPVPPSLIEDLLKHARARGATAPADPVLRYNRVAPNGAGHAPLTGRRYDTWAQRVQRALPWADTIGFGSHVLRHHAGTRVDRIAGYAVACRFLGHKPEGVTGRYVQATHEEVARAVAMMTGEPHPLAPRCA